METEARQISPSKPRSCPECGWPMSTDERFCQCGWERVEDCELQSVPDNLNATMATSLPENDSDRAHLEETRAPSPSAPLSDCDDFRLEYNQARIFLVGSASAFNFRLIPVSEDTHQIRDIEVYVESQGYLAYPLVKPKHSPRLQKTRAVEINFNMVPEQDGIDISGEVYLRYRKGHRQYAFSAAFEWDTYPPSVPANQVVENLSVRIGNISAHADRAGDAPVSLRFLDNIKNHGRYSKAAELRQLKIPKVWNTLCLTDHGAPQPPSIGEPPLQARQKHLTLEAPDGHLLHLIHAQNRVLIGKNRQCDIVTWFMTPDGSQRLADRTRWISRFHCRFEKIGGKWLVCDGYRERPSSYGTFLNGTKVSGSCGRVLPVDEGFTLWLAGAKRDDPYVFRFEGRLWTCAALGRCKMALHDQCNPSEPACLILKRTDGVPETFLLLWRFCLIEAIEKNLNETLGINCLFRHSNAYAFSGASGEKALGWLVPGLESGQLDADVKVRPYRQFGEWAKKGNRREKGLGVRG